ncbi:hypothetical protein ILYODFUR_006295 [Ilyodon furcidens]|uniref:Uncharacterized protein n=1 Tax=Ilyodon furcidens TaxID=33524 RepID=A0ABV0VBM0_9TELE
MMHRCWRKTIPCQKFFTKLFSKKGFGVELGLVQQELPFRRCALNISMEDALSRNTNLKILQHDGATDAVAAQRDPTHSWGYVTSAQPHYSNLCALRLTRPELQDMRFPIER